MAIGMVEMQGSIPRVQDFQTQQQFENDKGAIYQSQQHVEGEKQIEQNSTNVHEKEDANAETEADGKQRGGYAGDGGRHRRENGKEAAPRDRVVVKGRGSFDIKI
jgi:hypothetical protein